MQRFGKILIVGAGIGVSMIAGCSNTPPPEPRASIKAPPSLHDPGPRTLGFPSPPPDTIDRTIEVLVERLGTDIVVVREPIISWQYQDIPAPNYRIREFIGQRTLGNRPSAYIGELSPGTNASGYLRHAVFVHGSDKVVVHPRLYSGAVTASRWPGIEPTESTAAPE